MKTNKDTIKKILYEIQNLIINGQINDVNTFNKLIDDLNILDPSLASEVSSCYEYNPGWIFCGADFNSLEDYISALTTKDPNKLRVYAGFKQFDLTVNGITHRIRDTDVVKYDGELITGELLYEKLQGSKPRDIRYSG